MFQDIIELLYRTGQSLYQCCSREKDSSPREPIFCGFSRHQEGFYALAEEIAWALAASTVKAGKGVLPVMELNLFATKEARETASQQGTEITTAFHVCLWIAAANIVSGLILRLAFNRRMHHTDMITEMFERIAMAFLYVLLEDLGAETWLHFGIAIFVGLCFALNMVWNPDAPRGMADFKVIGQGLVTARGGFDPHPRKESGWMPAARAVNRLGNLTSLGILWYFFVRWAVFDYWFDGGDVQQARAIAIGMALLMTLKNLAQLSVGQRKQPKETDITYQLSLWLGPIGQGAFSTGEFLILLPHLMPFFSFVNSRDVDYTRLADMADLSNWKQADNRISWAVMLSIIGAAVGAGIISFVDTRALTQESFSQTKQVTVLAVRDDPLMRGGLPSLKNQVLSPSTQERRVSLSDSLARTVGLFTRPAVVNEESTHVNVFACRPPKLLTN